MKLGRWVLVLSLVPLASACRTVPEEPAQGRVPEVHAWTEAFLRESVLVADEIWIEGPQDLLEHVAIRQEPEVCEYRTETTRDGLRQEISLREEAVGADIRAQLDAWSVCALHKLVVLQRPGEASVRIVAAGNAAFLPTEGAEQRGPRLEFHGEREPR